MSTEFYQVLEHIPSEDGIDTLSASFTPNNGIRIQLLDSESEDPNWRVFDFTNDQAELIGQALVRWAQRRRAETELNLCGGHVTISGDRS